MASRAFAQCCHLRKCLVLLSSQGVAKQHKLIGHNQIFNSCANYSNSNNEAVDVQKGSNSLSENLETLRNISEGTSKYLDEKTAIELAKRSDPDTFGTLCPQKTKQLTYEKMLDELPDEGGDVVVETYADPEFQRKCLKMTEYRSIIKKLIKEKKIKDAIDVLEVKMLQEDRAKPTFHIYNELISACGHAGYTKKAFNLYNNMKKRGVRPNGGTYTSLFNACANCPFPGYGLQEAKDLKAFMDEKPIFIRPITYHAMIKAFGRLGQIDVAFSLVDEMMEKKLPLTAETFCFILQACISDKEAGFRHALLVWHKMRRKWIKPTIYSYNLLLRTVRECGTGDHALLQQTIDEIIQTGVPSPEEHKLLTEKSPSKSGDSFDLQNPKSSSLAVNSSQSNEVSENMNAVAPVSDVSTTGNENLTIIAENRPNLLTYRPHLGSILGVEEIKTPQDRLILLGGVNGILEEMESDKVKPNDVTFGLLLDCIPSTLAAEKALLSIIKKRKVQLSVAFYNSLIKKRAMRFDYASARDVLILMGLHNVQPDIMTFGALALSCKKKGDAEDLLQSMKEAEFFPNIEILGAMMRHACVQYSFGYIVYLMKYVKEEEIGVNKMFLKHLENFHTHCVDSFKVLHKSKKRNENANIPDFFNSQTFQESFTMFQKFYTYWLKNVKYEPTIHPWAEVKKEKKQKLKAVNN